MTYPPVSTTVLAISYRTFLRSTASDPQPTIHNPQSAMRSALSATHHHPTFTPNDGTTGNWSTRRIVKTSR